MQWEKTTTAKQTIYSPKPLPKIGGRNIVVNITKGNDKKGSNHEIYIKLSDDTGKKKNVDRLLFHGERKGLNNCKAFVEGMVDLMQEVMR